MKIHLDQLMQCCVHLRYFLLKNNAFKMLNDEQYFISGMITEWKRLMYFYVHLKTTLKGHGNDGHNYISDFNIYNASERHLDRQPIFDCHLLSYK